MRKCEGPTTMVSKLWLAFVNKVLLEDSYIICLNIAYGCFCITVAELSTVWDYIAINVKLFTICPFREKKNFANPWPKIAKTSLIKGEVEGKIIPDLKTYFKFMVITCGTGIELK